MQKACEVQRFRKKAMHVTTIGDSKTEERFSSLLGLLSKINIGPKHILAKVIQY